MENIASRFTDCTPEEIQQILQTGIALSKEHDRNRLLDQILDASMHITNCDAGTLYICKDNALHFTVMKTLSQNIDKGRCGEHIDLPPVPMEMSNICAYTVIHKKPLNIQDVYTDTTFDFTGPRKYDKLTGYHTQSMLTIPLMDQEDNAVGVLQLINAMDTGGNIIPFGYRFGYIILSLASQAAIAVSNIRFMEEIKEQMWSFTEAMAEAIDTRTPYNANHIRMVAKYTGILADHFNKLHEEGKEEVWFDPKHKERLVLSALMHDIGKVVIPGRVMNKATRLEFRLDEIKQRFQLFRARYEVQFLRGQLTEEVYQNLLDRLSQAEALVEDVNKAGFLPDEKEARLRDFLEDEYVGREGTVPYFTPEEKECLLIKKGTLTDKERRIMESHVEITDRILQKVHFNDQYKDAMVWAVQHHECLDGSGYPNHLTADQLPVESRILAVADICDALLATDRPYKKPLPREKAFAILHDMADHNKIDSKIVGYLEDCI